MLSEVIELSVFKRFSGKGRLFVRVSNAVFFQSASKRTKNVSYRIKFLPPPWYQNDFWYIDTGLIVFDILWYTVSNVPNPIKMIHFDSAYQSPTKERFPPYQSSIKLNAPLSRTATHAHLLHLLAYPPPLDSPIHSHALIYSNMPRGGIKN